MSLELLLEGSRDPALRQVLEDLDTKAREHLLKLRFPESTDPIDLARIEFSMAIFEGLQMRILRNPKIDLDAVSRLLAEKIYASRRNRQHSF